MKAFPNLNLKRCNDSKVIENGQKWPKICKIPFKNSFTLKNSKKIFYNQIKFFRKIKNGLNNCHLAIQEYKGHKIWRLM
jgi:hypothetical protein